MKPLPWFCGLAMAVAMVPAAIGAEPKLILDGQEVRVEGLTPGGQAVWFGIAHERDDWITVVVRREDLLPDDDRDGAVAFKLDHGVALLSIWAVVDLATGDFAIASPEGAEARPVDWPGNSVVRGPRGALQILQARREFLEVLLVRPGVGAWGLSLGDGGASDADARSDGTIQADLARMKAVKSDTPPPAEFLPGDVAVVIDPTTMEYYAAKFAPGR